MIRNFEILIAGFEPPGRNERFASGAPAKAPAYAEPFKGFTS